MIRENQRECWENSEKEAERREPGDLNLNWRADEFWELIRKDCERARSEFKFRCKNENKKGLKVLI